MNVGNKIIKSVAISLIISMFMIVYLHLWDSLKGKHDFGQNKETIYPSLVSNIKHIPSQTERKTSIIKNVYNPETFQTQGKTKVNFVELGPISPKNVDSGIWPDRRRKYDDRIINQLSFVPPLAQELKGTKKLKVIVPYDGVAGNNVASGQTQFIREKCPVETCYIADSLSLLEKADAVILKAGIENIEWFHRPSHQIWVLSTIEAPTNTYRFSALDHKINWTATYRPDSTIVTPYDKYVTFSNAHLPRQPRRNYAKGKTRKVAWFVSNCISENGRLQYAKELAKYIEVDIYGLCGAYKCPSSQPEECFKILARHYKFYLSFENSNCKYYITEKFFKNALRNKVIPIVMGARKEDYYRVAPPDSYIHIEDFDTAKELAQYLHKLDERDDLYNQYFRWRETGTFVDGKFWCRLCALLHDNDGRRRWYRHIDNWWHAEGVCVYGRWDRKPLLRKTHD